MSVKRFIFGLGAAGLFTAILGVFLFPVAGRWDLPWFWAYLSAYGVGTGIALLFLDPGLIKERFKPGKNARDTAIVWIGKILGLVHYVIAALDVGRFHWSDNIPTALQGGAFVLLVVTGGAALRTMIINPFFSSVVRIQKERGHHLISDGPYGIVRHPGYLFISVLMLTSGIALGSWWSAVPMWVLLTLVIRRTLIEDRFLHEHLDGYPQYAQRVRYRLIPGVW